MNKDTLTEILQNHIHWLNQDCEGWENMKADLSDAYLSYANLRNANLRNADLSDAYLSYANLRNADLSYANLRNADLSYANLRNADLRNADLRNADLRNADLRNTDLSDAYLRNADLSYANLRNADLRNADLRNADLSDAYLRNADLSGADLSGADLSGADLSGAKGLKSSIDYLTENFEKYEEGIIAYKTFGGSYPINVNWKIKPGSIISENVNANRTNECGCGINIAPLDWVKNNYEGDIWKVLIKWEWLCGVVVPYNTDGKIRCERIQLIEIVER